MLNRYTVKTLLSSLILLLMTTGVASAQGIEFFEGSFEEAKVEAKKQDKLIFMDAYASWCGPCKRLAKQVFPQEKVGTYFNENFINLKVDCEKGDGRAIARQYKVTAYPTIFFLASDGSIVHMFKGGRTADGLIKEAQKALTPNPGLVEKMNRQYEEGERSPDFLHGYLKTLSKARKDYDEVFVEYLDQLTEEQKLDGKNAKLIFDLTKTMESPGLTHVLDYREYYEGELGAGKVDDKLNGIAQNEVYEAIAANDKAMVKGAIKFLKKNRIPDMKMKSLQMYMDYYKGVKDWNAYHKSAVKFEKKYVEKEAVRRKLANTHLKYIEGQKQLEVALNWALACVNENDIYVNNLLVAKIYHKMGNNSDALVYAQLARDMAIAQKKNPTEASRLIKTIKG